MERGTQADVGVLQLHPLGTGWEVAQGRKRCQYRPQAAGQVAGGAAAAAME
jgi:hypothetical protein